MPETLTVPVQHLDNPCKLPNVACRFYAACTAEEAAGLYRQCFGVEPAEIYSFSSAPSGIVYALPVPEVPNV